MKSSVPSASHAPSAPQDASPDQLLRQFRMLLGVVKAHFQEVEKVAGLGGAQVWALSVIARQPGVGVGDLAQALDIRQPTASNLVRSLVDAGLVRASRNAEDRRLSHLHVTEAGQARLDQVPGPLTGVLPDALQRLDPATAASLHQNLDALLRLLEVDGRTAMRPLARL